MEMADVMSSFLIKKEGESNGLFSDYIRFSVNANIVFKVVIR